jgi:thioredoxin reductase (NADPH)
MEEYNCEILIIGAGPAGLSAGVYCGRSNRDTIILDGKELSSLAKTKEIQNWLGEQEISGIDLLNKFKAHAKSYEKVRIVPGDVISLMIGMGTNMISTRTANITSDIVIIATGTGKRKEVIKGESNLIGFLYGNDEEVLEDALALHQMGCKTHVITILSMNDLPPIVNDVKAQGIEIIEKMEIVEAISDSDGVIQKIICKPVDSEEIVEYELSCLFILSHIPSNSIFKKAGVELDEYGNIKVDEHQQTNVKGVYAAGDVTGGLFQVVFATAEGARAGINACKLLRQQKKD